MSKSFLSRFLGLSLAVGLLAGSANLQAAESDPATLLAERGKLIYSNDLSEFPNKDWHVAKGKWEANDGGVRGAELPEDKHGAVTRHQQAFTNAIIQFSIKLDGSKTTSLSINDAKEHLCRLLVRPNGFTVQKDDQDHAGPDKAVVFQNVTTPITPGEWHTFTVELLNKEMVATMDGQQTGFGSHEAIATPKANLGFTVAGQSASFKNVRIWEALPNPNWEKTKAKLQATPAKP